MERKIWMVWVAGHGSPKRMHPTYESAKSEADRLKSTEHRSREIYIFESIEILPGRKIITLKPRPDACVVEHQGV